MTFQEHNNRAKANKFAEYITGEVLRRYVAEKVEKYCGKNASVFDGAAGSGQLEQFIQPTEFVAVEIQAESCAALKNNYPQAAIFNESFFTYQGVKTCDCVVMNPPFSLKFKDLSEVERAQIQTQFPWKKSGVVDDIFVLKGLNQAERFGFFILFPGVAYRQTEKKFREILGNSLVELNLIQNAFEDTAIDVLFLVVDKAKTGNKTHRELFNCNIKQVISADEWVIDPERWEQVPPPKVEQEKPDPFGWEMAARERLKNQVRTELRISKHIMSFGFGDVGTYEDFNGFCDELIGVVEREKFEISAH